MRLEFIASRDAIFIDQLGLVLVHFVLGITLLNDGEVLGQVGLRIGAGTLFIF